jgi:type I restriction enzyme, S subunit
MDEFGMQKKLPAGWIEINLGNAVKLVSGSTPKGVNNTSNIGEFPFFKVSDMNTIGNEIFMKKANLNLSQEEVDALKIKLYPEGTVIFPKRGGAILTNKKRILHKASGFDLNIMGALPNKNINRLYLFYWFIKLDLSKIYDGSNVPQINNKNIEPLDFPLPLSPNNTVLWRKSRNCSPTSTMALPA